jgi:hypothetical protein
VLLDPSPPASGASGLRPRSRRAAASAGASRLASTRPSTFYILHVGIYRYRPHAGAGDLRESVQRRVYIQIGCSYVGNSYCTIQPYSTNWLSVPQSVRPQPNFWTGPSCKRLLASGSEQKKNPKPISCPQLNSYVKKYSTA